MNAIYTECSIGFNGDSPIFGGNRAIIRVHDQGAGPYLGIRGATDEPIKADGETKHDFFLCTEAEIDKFADICKAMLRQAEPAPVAVVSAGDNDGGVK